MGEHGDDLGSVGEEAVKLLGALQAWAKDSGSDYAKAASDAAANAATSVNAVNEHIATGAEDCRYCPVCQVISAVRETSPEVKQHLASAATSLMQAASGVLATHVPDKHRQGRPDTGVEKIDLSDGDDWEDD